MKSFWESLSPEARGALQARAERRAYTPGQGLLEGGEPAGGLYVLARGRVKLYLYEPTHERYLLLEIVEPGEPLNLEALWSAEPGLTRAEALDPVQAYYVPREALRPLVLAHPEIAQQFLSVLSRAIKALQRRIIEWVRRGSEARLAQVLLALGERHGCRSPQGLRLEVQLTRRELAELAGLTPETAIRVLGRWRRAGLIAVEGRTLLLRDRDALRRYLAPSPPP